MSEINSLKENLLSSHWPKCNQIAEQLYSIGTEEAKNALINGLKGKRHHIRTASMRALAKFQDASLAEYIRPLLNDPSYEARVQAKDSIKQLTGEEF